MREARAGFRIFFVVFSVGRFPSLSPQVVLVTGGISVGKKKQEMIPRFCWWQYLLGIRILLGTTPGDPG